MRKTVMPDLIRHPAETAMTVKGVFVTHKLQEFKRVEGIVFEDWD